ncbi:MAG TPA: FAD-dependent oxidoreductase [Myxococcales bacterium]
MTRREFLLAVLGAPVALAACRTTSPTPSFGGRLLGTSDRLGHRLVRREAPSDGGEVERTGICIVGGGIAGLAAGWRLLRAGFDDFVVLEAEPQPGGTSASGSNPASAFPWAAHYICAPTKENRPLVTLLDEMGVVEGTDPRGEPVFAEEVLCRAPQERLFMAGAWWEGLYPMAGASAEDLRQYRAFEAAMDSWAARRDAQGRRAFTLPVSKCSDDPEFLALDQRSMATWMDQQGFTSPRLRWYVDYACRDDFGLRLEETSAWAGLFYYASRIPEPGEKPAEFLTWPEGNGRAVAHLTGRLGGRVRTGAMALQVRHDAPEPEVRWVDARTGQARRTVAKQVICATPAFVTRYLLGGGAASEHLQAFHYSPWIIANLTLKERPASRGFPLAWDNVFHDSQSLGYVDAGFQAGRDRGPTVWTWYLPLCGPDPKAVRRKLLLAGWDAWRDAIGADLFRAHQGLEGLIESADVWRWGHAMVRPETGFVWGGAPQRARQALGAVHFANTDLSGVALFEEALDHGLRAAEEALAGLGIASETMRR